MPNDVVDAVHSLAAASIQAGGINSLIKTAIS